MSTPLLVFDMDGVLVDVTESYRETIARTVEYFAKAKISREQIQDYKNQGGWNDDWKLSHHIITISGVEVPFEQVVEYFQKIFHGENGNGLILREQWVARPGVLEELNKQFRFAVFTGRPKWEAEVTIQRFAPQMQFDPIVGMHEVLHHKPAPDGLLQILEQNPGSRIYYIGDSIDDAQSAKAAEVPFIGIAAPSNPRYLDLVFLFQEAGAYAIVDDINYLGEVFRS
ncbi:MAG TPA: HAD-IA family hydrolase [Bryobacteraceae bacterium]|nr:HAD-IA family hydrolase [Bryobacteraceae bacterium]